MDYCNSVLGEIFGNVVYNRHHRHLQASEETHLLRENADLVNTLCFVRNELTVYGIIFTPRALRS